MKYFFEVVLVGKKPTSSSVTKYIFQVDHGQFHARPGQYVWVTLPKLTYPDTKGARRALYVYPEPLNNQFAVFIQNSNSGYKKSLNELPVGSRVLIAGPFGSALAILEPPQTDLVFIGQDTFAVPLISNIQSEMLRNCQKLVTFIFIHKNTDEHFLSEDLEKRAKEEKIKLIHINGDFSWEATHLDQNTLQNYKFYVNVDSEQLQHILPGLTAHGVDMKTVSFDVQYPMPKDNLSKDTIDEFISEKHSLGLLAVEQSNNHIVITDANGVILYVNRAAQNITGFTAEEMIGNTPRIWGGIMEREFYKNFWERIKSGKSFIGQFTNRRKNGQPYHTIANVSPVTGDSGNIIGYIETEEDITQRVFFEEYLKIKNISLAQEQQQVSALFESLGEGVIAIDLQGMILKVNPTALSLLGYKVDDLLGRSYVKTIRAEDEHGNAIAPQNRTAILGMTQGKRIQGTQVFIRKDGIKFVAGIVSTPVIVNGNPFGSIVVFRDITREKEVDRMKTEFISLASHQLRTPLSAMKWFMQMLLKGDAGALTPQQKEMITNVYYSNERMIELVNSLLNVSRIESGRIIVEPVPTDIRELLKGIQTDLTAKLKEKNQNLTILISSDLPKINLDPKLIRQVYLNLLTNAIKYSPEKTEIAVRVSQNGTDMFSQISDHGFGIPARDKDKVFGKLYRGENILTKVTDGNGLGLYLVKQIIESSKGKIWFDSVENKGTTFYFSLPLSGMQKKAGEVRLDS